MAELQLQEHTPLLRELLDEADRAGAYLIVRLQRVESRSLNIANGVTESMAATLSQGIGLQVFDREGHTSFASTDRIESGPAGQALRTALAGLRAAAQAGLQANDAIYAVEPTQSSEIGTPPYSLDHLSL